MKPLPKGTTDVGLLAIVDQWAGLLEAEDYAAAFAFTSHDSAMGWTPQLMRAVIKGYGDALESQRVTVEGKPTDVHQRKAVTRWESSRRAGIGEIWYDLNIDGLASDLTATFWILEKSDGLYLELNDIHVM